MKVEFLGKKWSVSLLFFPLLIWMCKRNGGGETAAFLLALALHESGHMLAARAFGIEVTEVQVLPFGCAAKMPGIASCNSSAELLTAAAGPGVNLFAAAALLLLRAEQGSAFLQSFCKYHVGMAAVNLLPVLPMDGGRIFCAAFSLAVGERRAACLTGLMGMLAGSAMVAAGGFLAARGAVNLTLPISGIFMLGASIGYFREAMQSNPEGMWMRRRQIGKENAAQVRAIALRQEKTLGSALTQVHRRAYNMIYILNESFYPVGILDEQTLTDLAVQYGASTRFEQLPFLEKGAKRLGD